MSIYLCCFLAIVTLQIFSLERDWSNASCARTSALCPALGNIPAILCCEQYLKDSKHNSLHLERKCARRFVPGHYLFLAAHGSSLLGTDNVRGQISEDIFAPNRDYITSIGREIMLGYLPADVIYSEKRTGFQERSYTLGKL